MNKLVNCRCGGEAHHISASCWNHRVICKNCGTQTKTFYTEAEAIEIWNRAMGERTAKVVDLMFPIGTSLEIVGESKIGYEWLCANCIKLVHEGDDYCSHCGARLEWK